MWPQDHFNELMFVNKFLEVFLSSVLKCILLNNLLNVKVKYTVILNGLKCCFYSMVFKDAACCLKDINTLKDTSKYKNYSLHILLYA